MKKKKGEKRVEIKKEREKENNEKEKENKSRKKERLPGNFCHCIHACPQFKKRISKLWILGRKECFRFSFFCRFKKKTVGGKCYPLPHPKPPLGEGRSQVGRREGKKEAKRNGGMRDRDSFGNWSHFIFICLWLFIFFCCLICMEFFVILFFFFFCYTLPCFFFFFVKFWGIELACHFALLFIAIWCIFFWGGGYLHGFSVVFFAFFCKFNSSWHFFTSSDHVPPGGWLHSAFVSRTGIEG